MTAGPDLQEALRAYWEDPQTVSILDTHLHELEIQAVLRYLQPTDVLADVGCGDGMATARYAAVVRHVDGLERSASLRARASRLTRLPPNMIVQDCDVLGPVPEAAYDAIVSQRCLINLPSWDEQQRAIRHLHRMLKVGGTLILVENTNEAFQAMNDLRVQMGLARVPQHWHNRFFDYDALTAFMGGGFQLLRHEDFGLYYLLTRVFTQMFARFEGFGAQAVKDPIFAQADAAARRLHQAIGNLVTLNGGRAFGPIQVFVYRREAGEWRA